MRNAYLVAQVFESKGDELTLWNSSHAEIKPGAIVLAFHVRRGITCDPDIKIIFQVASLGSGQITATELAAEHNVRLRNSPSGALRVRVEQLAAVNRLERR